MINSPVNLQTAFEWTCPSCESSNFASSWAAEDSDAELEAAYRECHEIDDWQELPKGWQEKMCMAPLQVVCRSCKERYPTNLG